MPSRISKPTVPSREEAPRPIAGLPARRRRYVCVACLTVLLAGLSACGVSPVRWTISLHELETAPVNQLHATRRHIVSDPAAPRPLYQPLGRRFGLIQVCSEDQWEQLSHAAQHVGPCPDLRCGIVVGLVSEAGTPLDGGWPFRWQGIRLCEGAGLIEASFNAGNYLPDGTTWLETAYVERLRKVLVVSVDGSRYYPPDPKPLP